MRLLDDSLPPERQGNWVIAVTCRDAGETLAQLGWASNCVPGQHGSTMRRAT